jgi:hypothetical protein
MQYVYLCCYVSFPVPTSLWLTYSKSAQECFKRWQILRESSIVLDLVLSFTRLWNLDIVPADEGRYVTQHFVVDVFQVRENDVTRRNTGSILILTSVAL